MIKQIRLKDYVLIDELTVDFDNGLNVITGETGAGKSILINAIDLVFASRVSKEVIKTGCDKAVIELVIDNQKHNLYAFYSENGIDDWGSEIVISKEITPTAVRSRINGTLVSTDVLCSLRNLFVDIHSQHQTYSYLQPKYHINLLDSYGKNLYGSLLDEYKTLYAEYEELLSKLEVAKKSANATESQLDFLRFQINEIESAQIQSETEDSELQSELEVLENAEKLKELAGSSYWALNGDGESVIDALNKIKNNISKIVSYDNKLTDIEQMFVDATENIRDVASELNSYSQNLNNDTERLNNIQERLFLLDKLKHKYGNSLESVLNTYNKLSEELSSIEFSTQNIEELEQKINLIKEVLLDKAMKISEYRNKLAITLSEQIQSKLELLELPKSRFKINVINKDLSENGVNDVEFLISTNISEDLKPLVKVASGGEVSRVMLAIKSIFAENDNIDTVIFDEIDTGISGKTSQSVAEEIVNLSKSHQIILITHQAIIASKANTHLYVKKVQENSTEVKVYTLSSDEKLQALAELASGNVNEQSLEFAKSLIN